MSVSIATPSQFVSNFDHLVTQWMSLVIFSRGSATNSSHVQRSDWPSVLRTVRSHTDSGVRGVGPAESTGKSRVSYWPGGRRAAAPSGWRRPRNPREMGLITTLRERILRNMRESLPYTYLTCQAAPGGGAVCYGPRGKRSRNPGRSRRLETLNWAK